MFSTIFNRFSFEKFFLNTSLTFRWNRLHTFDALGKSVKLRYWITFCRQKSSSLLRINESKFTFSCCDIVTMIQKKRIVVRIWSRTKNVELTIERKSRQKFYKFTAKNVFLCNNFQAYGLNLNVVCLTHYVYAVMR